jgi:hypothetical protein
MERDVFGRGTNGIFFTAVAADADPGNRLFVLNLAPGVNALLTQIVEANMMRRKTMDCMFPVELP